MQAIKQELSMKPASGVFKMVSNSVGGILGARQPEQLPRSKQQLYDMKSKMKKSVACTETRNARMPERRNAGTPEY